MFQKLLMLLVSLCLLLSMGCSKNEEAIGSEQTINIFCSADLHAAQQSLPVFLQVVKEAVEKGENCFIVINGDIFERGNVVSLHSDGAVEWDFLDRLNQIAPVFVNIGNHEGALSDDLRTVVNRMEIMGVTVLSNISDPGFGYPLANPVVNLTINGLPVSITGAATNDLSTYRTVHRDVWHFPSPFDYANNELPGLLNENGLNIILNHGGLLSDKYIFEELPKGSLLVGGHDHLIHTQRREGVLAIHTGWWASFLGKVTATRNESGAISFDYELINLKDYPTFDQDLQSFVINTESDYLQNEDLEELVFSAKALDPITSMEKIAEVLLKASGADALCINNTTMGASIPEGAIRRYDLDAIIRFDGSLENAIVTGVQLQSIREKANQHEWFSWENKTGEYLIGHFPDLIYPDSQYTIAVNKWVSFDFNQQRFLGVEGLDFETNAQVQSIKQALVEGL